MGQELNAYKVNDGVLAQALNESPYLSTLREEPFSFMDSNFDVVIRLLEASDYYVTKRGYDMVEDAVYICGGDRDMADIVFDRLCAEQRGLQEIDHESNAEDSSQQI